MGLQVSLCGSIHYSSTDEDVIKVYSLALCHVLRKKFLSKDVSVYFRGSLGVQPACSPLISFRRLLRYLRISSRAASEMDTCTDRFITEECAYFFLGLESTSREL